MMTLPEVQDRIAAGAPDVYCMVMGAAIKQLIAVAMTAAGG